MIFIRAIIVNVARKISFKVIKIFKVVKFKVFNVSISRNALRIFYIFIVIASIVTILSRYRVSVIIFSINSKSKKINSKNEIDIHHINEQDIIELIYFRS